MEWWQIGFQCIGIIACAFVGLFLVWQILRFAEWCGDTHRKLKHLEGESKRWLCYTPAGFATAHEVGQLREAQYTHVERLNQAIDRGVKRAEQVKILDQRVQALENAPSAAGKRPKTH